MLRWFMTPYRPLFAVHAHARSAALTRVTWQPLTCALTASYEHTLSLVSEGNARTDVTLKLKRPSAVYRVRSLLLER